MDQCFIFMRYFSCKNEDGRAMLIPFASFYPKRNLCRFYMVLDVCSLLKSVLLFGAMDFSGGESMFLEPGQWRPFHGESLLLGIFTFYLFGERYF